MADSLIQKFALPSEVIAEKPSFMLFGFTTPTITCSANSAPAAINMDATKEGWRPIGVVGFNTNNVNIVPMIAVITTGANNTFGLQYKVRNVANSQQSAASFVYVLYVSSNTTVY